ncbi:hypothetical protein GCM10007036_34900 [Alsobacter metallidurans]|uniref:Uncharacterized protein n=1 Tax=Alsobacter metallidurans TaxID=340221 RepID=A0A917I8N6_9HYPH|nr:hypothetical protein [Alsobacter metallidurans]GGH26809.1 hypothetical protein GCM10007036_34900 [Alsobacter metallidurans]
MAEHDAGTERLAECAALLIGVTRMMLDAEPKAFAAWLRRVADDIEAEAAEASPGELPAEARPRH